MPFDGFAIGLLFSFAVAMVLYGATTGYLEPAANTTAVAVLNQYEVYSNIHVMAFVGFGILMTFQSNIGLTAAGHSLVLGSVAALWHMLIRGLLEQAIAGVRHPLATVRLSRDYLVSADFAVSSVLIAFGALIGRVTALQAFLMTVIHVMFYTVNEELGVHALYVTDAGGSMTIHLFGALLGVTSAWVLDRQAGRSETAGSAVTTSVSNVRALLGTAFLYCFFPSFNCYVASNTLTPSLFANCTSNTYLSLLASAFVAIVISRSLNNTRTLVADVQNSVLAAGVVMGAVSPALVQPFGAIAIGSVSAGIAVFGIDVVNPALARWGIRDSCSVFGLHGLPGFCGGVIAIITAATAVLYRYPSPAAVWPGYAMGFSQSRMSAFQLAYLLLTIGLSIAGGIVAGIVMRLAPSLQRFYTDTVEWAM